MQDNLWHRYFKNNQQAQVATLITLIIAAIFLFMAISINIGKVSTKKTNLSNATDTASLQFASSLGSYARYLSKTFLKGKAKICKFSWSMFWKSFMWGGLVGLIVTAITGGKGAAAGIFGGPSVYAEASAWNKITREFKKMSKKMQVKEGVILTAWFKSVDDPNLIADIHDADEDGQTDDLVPKFLDFYFNERLLWIKNKYLPTLTQIVEDFIPKVKYFDEQAWAFRDYLYQKVSDFENYLDEKFIPLLQQLEACNYKVSFWDSEDEVPLECDELYPPDVCQQYEEGCGDTDDEESDVDDVDKDCISCNLYEEYLKNFPHDPLDTLIFEIEDFHKFAYGEYDEEGDFVEGLYKQEITDLVNTIDIWHPLLYEEKTTDEDEDEDDEPDEGDECDQDEPFYDVFGRWHKWIGDDSSGWLSELKKIDNQINQCVQQTRRRFGYCPDDYCCCKLEGKIPPAINKFKNFQTDIRDFRNDILDFHYSAENLENQWKHKGYYSWKDKFGDKEVQHHVFVEVKKKIKIPYIKTYTKDFKKCAKLKHKSKKVWVRIKRFDEPQTGYPDWTFRYHKDKADTTIDFSDPTTIPDKYWTIAESKAKYSYKKRPPKIVKIKGVGKNK